MSDTGENPYAPPSAALREQAARTTPLSFALDIATTPALVALTALVWFPLNLGIEFRAAQLDPDDWRASIQLANGPNLFASPLILGAALEACRLRQAGEEIRFLALTSAAMRHWRSLFVVELVAGFLIMLGFAALVVPGIVLALRYSLAAVVCVREGAGQAAARARSAELARGRYGTLTLIYLWHLASLVAFVPMIIASAFGIDWLAQVVPLAIADTVVDLISLAPIAGFCAIYDEARQQHAP